MRCLISNNSNPYFNLATEEYFLKRSSDEIFMLYINEPSIIVGKHQNILSEINLPFARGNKIKLARRISGGGAVYQDFNNLNFSFIHNCENRDQISFTKFTIPILEALSEIGILAEFSGRNDLLIDSRKISGNAMHIYKTRVLSHGTLLFQTDLNKLSSALRSHPEKYTDKSIKSVRSEVTNIHSYLDPNYTIERLKDHIFQYILIKNDQTVVIPLSAAEVEEIKKISKEKFESWNWIYGYSPKYVFRNSFIINNYSLDLELIVEKGIIIKSKLNIFPENINLISKLTETLRDTQHDYDLILLKMKEMNNNISDLKYTITELCDNLF